MRMTVSVLTLGWLLASAAQAQQAPAPQTAPPAPTRPDSTPAAEPADDEGEEVVVTGQRPFGSVDSDIKPEQQLGPADIRSYGVSSVADLLTELAPQTNAAAGPPVVLLNGKRISGFQEIRDIPPEAIQRVEILPEDVSLAYGYAANQKVVNIVLRRRFRALTGELGAGTTTEGGRANGKASADLLHIRRQTRLNLDVTYTAADRLLESQRDIDPTAPARPFSLAGNVTAPPGAAAAEIDPALSALAGRPVTLAAVLGSAANGRPTLASFLPGANVAGVDNLGRYRTLSPATDNLAINAVYATPLSDTVSASFNGRVEFSGSDALQGLPGLSLLLPAANPYSPFSNPVQLYRYSDSNGALSQQSRTSNVHLGGTLNGRIDAWNWTFTGNYDRIASRTETERGIDGAGLQGALNAGDPALNPFGALPPNLLAARLVDRARSVSSTLAGDLLLNGPLFQLPAGWATTSITVSGSASDFDSRSRRGGVISPPRDFSRDIGGVKASIDLPIASRRRGVLPWLGEFALNGNAEVQRLSDYGRLTSIGYGLRWSPIPAVRLIASVTDDRAAPTGQQLNNPLIVTPNVPVFDYRTGATVFVSQVGGGNPALLESERHRLRLSLTVKPWTAKDLTMTALFNDNRTDNPVGSFPVPTPQIEDAFPGRFVRENGVLTQVDVRPVNYAEQRSTTLRYGFNFSVPLKSALQKKVEAWRAAGAKPEDRPKELGALRELFQRERGRRQEERGGSAPDNAPPAQGEPPADGQPPRPDSERGGFGGGPGGGGPGGGRGFGGGGFGGRGGGGGRMQFALYHTWHINEDITIAPGLPKLDLLDGAAIGGSGGQPRHEVEAQAGYTNNGLGARLSGNWRSATRVDGALGAINSTLRFGSLATLDLRLFANLGQRPELVKAHPFFAGSRVTLAVTNLFDSKQDVRDGTGAVPLSYQPDYLDPLGRRVVLSFRKLFF